MRIFLIGFMGSGKSTFGKELAEQAGLAFADLDDIIETEQRQSIREIFDHGGEERFRVAEHEALLRTIHHTDELVLALGGGTPCFFGHMELLNKTGTTVYLKYPPEVLFGYLQNEPDKRPLLSGMSPDELLKYIQDKLREREPFYMQAQKILEWPDISVPSLLKALNF